MRDELQIVRRAVLDLPVAELPRLLGDLEELRVIAMQRLTFPAPSKAQAQADELLGVPEAARRLGMSRDYLYRHHRDLPFTRRVGKKLLFSALGIDAFIQSQSILTAGRQRVNLSAVATKGRR